MKEGGGGRGEGREGKDGKVERGKRGKEGEGKREMESSISHTPCKKINTLNNITFATAFVF